MPKGGRTVEWFNKLTTSSLRDFEEFALENEFGDTAFSLSYAWAERFNYCYYKTGSSIAVCGRGIDNAYGFYIINKKGDPIDESGDYILDFCKSRGITPSFEYIGDSELDLYRDFARKRGLDVTFDHSDSLSDYVYAANDYILLGGGANKTKRGSVNNLLRSYPDIEYRVPSESEVHSLVKTFEEWCEQRCCADCHYGCELRAFSRFLSLYDPARHIIRLAVSGGEVLSFFAGEVTDPQTICCFFQKNVRRIRGLTYWLSRRVMMEHPKIRYINLGEDMGIKGIAAEKKLLRPCKIIKKYSMIVRSDIYE